jgi:hypothetical protein
MGRTETGRNSDRACPSTPDPLGTLDQPVAGPGKAVLVFLEQRAPADRPATR